MERYINAEEFERYFKRDDWGTPDERWRPEREFGAMVDSIPTADVKEVKHGEWICESFDCAGISAKWNKWYCSECKIIAKKGWSTSAEGLKPSYLYCPDCGAKMDGKENE